MHLLVAALLISISWSCVDLGDDVPELPGAKEEAKQKQLGFDITVTRDGQSIPRKSIATRGESASVEAGTKYATMDTDVPFGLIGVDFLTHQVVINNAKVSSGADGYSGWFDGELWQVPDPISFSAYYPYVNKVEYGRNNETYSIPFQSSDTDKGPLVSKTTEQAVNLLYVIPLEFGHITNDIGYRICDVTTDPQLQGLIHLRKLTATNVASAGVFVNDMVESRGQWTRQGYYKDIVVFEGDAVLGVGSENEKFVGHDSLVDHMTESSRYYSVPDEIVMGKQCVEVVYDVDSFTVDGFTYKPLKDLHGKFMLYGLLPGNVFEYGKQYTFHLGLDTGKLYQQVAFSASVSDWETKIYENNEDF